MNGLTRTVAVAALGLALAAPAGDAVASAARVPAARPYAHDGSDSPGGSMPGMDHGSMPGMQMPGDGHVHQHGTPAADRPRDVVIGGFVGVNVSILVAAGVVRQRRRNARQQRVPAARARRGPAAR